MRSDWPSGLDQFGDFLKAQGLSFERQGIVDHAYSGYGYASDMLWQYGTSRIGVRVVADKGTTWVVCIADIAGWPQQWYAVHALRELLTDDIDDDWPHSGENNRVGEQMKFVEEYWPAIVDSFREGKRERTHEALKRIGQEQNRRRFGL